MNTYIPESHSNYKRLIDRSEKQLPQPYFASSNYQPIQIPQGYILSQVCFSYPIKSCCSVYQKTKPVLSCCAYDISNWRSISSWQPPADRRNRLYYGIYPLWPSDAIWRHRSGSALAQVMGCCLTAPSHYLNQCWLIILEVQWQSPNGNFTNDTTAINHWN